jgi:hypothetical protein
MHLNGTKPDYFNSDISAFSKGAEFFLDLSSPSGSARIKFSIAAINAFVLRTLMSVPQGKEIDYMSDEFDKELREWLERED